MTHPPPREFPFPFVDNYDVRDSSFFRNGGGALPTPDQVRLWANRPSNMDRGHHFLRPPAQRYRRLDLAVKYGNHVSIAEAHCLLFLRAHAPTIPVPELFGWRRDHRQTFLYMNYVNGVSGASIEGAPQWHMDAVAAQVRAVVDTLRAIPQSLVSPMPFVGHVNGTHLRDWFIINSATPPASAGPFPSVAAFHDWLAHEHGTPADGGTPLPVDEVRRYRAQLPDDAAITLTHGGLTLNNIIVSRPRATGTVRLLAVVDWTQAGWYPSYWENLRMDIGDRQKESEYMDAYDYFVMNAAT